MISLIISLWGAANGLSGLLRVQNRVPTRAKVAPRVALWPLLVLPVSALRGSSVNPCRGQTPPKSKSKKKGAKTAPFLKLV
jgi:hypothetical protein